MSRESSMTQVEGLRERDRSSSQLREYKAGLSTPNLSSQTGESSMGDCDQPRILQQYVQQTPNSETSLRHFFYLEFKRNFQDGQQNPIVYSRFGKRSYDSEERFDPASFNQLIRTCNLKRLLKS